MTTVVRWFPDKRGAASGLTGLGFGAGALIAAPLAAHLIAALGPLTTFRAFGAVYLVVVLGTASVMRNPPVGFTPAGWRPGPELLDQQGSRSYTLMESLGTWQLYAISRLSFERRPALTLWPWPPSLRSWLSLPAFQWRSVPLDLGRVNRGASIDISIA